VRPGEVSQANEAQQIEMLGLVEAGSEAALQEVISKDACRHESCVGVVKL
jgi:hypothetical protein